MAQSVDEMLVQQIRSGSPDAWQSLIDRYEGRLLAYVDRRIRDRATAEDIVQDALVGFLTSLPNYDGSRPLEAYLFSICGYKLTDHLRRQGRRPSVQMHRAGDSDGPGDIVPVSEQHGASTIFRSSERRKLETDAIQSAIEQQIQRWRKDGNWTKLQAIELLFVRGWGNKVVAQQTGLTEQQIANYKSDFVIRLRSVIGRMGLDEGVFPELAADKADGKSLS